jgi:hypothetical protein
MKFVSEKVPFAVQIKEPVQDASENNRPFSRKVLLFLVSFCAASILLIFMIGNRNNAGVLASQQWTYQGDDDSVRIGDNYEPLPGDDDDGRKSNEMNTLKKPWNCLGAPYLYVTVHDKSENVLKYSRDGCLLSTNVLIIDAKEGHHDVELRSMAVGKHKDNEALFIADASNHNSRILVFGNCIDDQHNANYGRRPFVTYVADSYHNAGVDHSYGVCLDGEGNIYVSNQHTDCVLRFSVGSFLPMSVPQALQLDYRLKYYDGTFVQFGLPKEHEKVYMYLYIYIHIYIYMYI